MVRTSAPGPEKEGPLNSEAFKNTWNEYGEEYLRATTESVSVLTPEQIKEQALAASAKAKAEAAEKTAAPVRPTTWKDPAPPGAPWHGVEYTLQDDGNIVYFDPVRKDKNGSPLRLMVRPGSESHVEIMKHQPESEGTSE